MTRRVRAVLEERKELGPDAYVFGAESGGYVASFDTSPHFHPLPMTHKHERPASEGKLAFLECPF
jgi:hypothetical protein